MNNNPLISVIMPVYNCEKTVSIAIDSILNQTYKYLELIVVDDASTDKTAKIVQDLANKDDRIKLFDGRPDPYRFDKKLNRNVNAGYLARNIGFEKAKGELVTFQDADDASLPNRLEIQLMLLNRYDSTHVTLDWFKFNETKLGKKLDPEKYLGKIGSLGPKELFEMSQRSKGLVAKISIGLNRIIPFHLKRKRVINKLFFGSLENYPGAGNSPLFRREVIDRVRFRKLKDRVWPSFMGRGADKDFNFQVAETFRNSHVFFIPLYMWQVPTENEKYANIPLHFLD